jgi:hypothetical protein
MGLHAAISLTLRHHQIVKYIITSSFESYWIIVSTCDRDENNCTADPVEHTGFFFRKVAYSRCDVTSEMFETGNIQTQGHLYFYCET